MTARLATYATLRAAVLHEAPGGRGIGQVQPQRVFQGRPAAAGWVELARRGKTIGYVEAAAVIVVQRAGQIRQRQTLAERVADLERRVLALETPRERAVGE